MQQLLQVGEAQFMRMKQRQATEYIAAHPGAFFKAALDRFADTWTGLSDVPADRWVSALHAGTAYIAIITTFSLFSFAGLYLLWRSLGWEAAPIWIAFLVFPITYYITHSILRYRHPIDPTLMLLTAMK